jgi:hypothetical protein
MNINGFIWSMADDLLHHVYDRTNTATSSCRRRHYPSESTPRVDSLPARDAISQRRTIRRQRCCALL